MGHGGSHCVGAWRQSLCLKQMCLSATASISRLAHMWQNPPTPLETVNKCFLSQRNYRAPVGFTKLPSQVFAVVINPKPHDRALHTLCDHTQCLFSAC